MESGCHGFRRRGPGWHRFLCLQVLIGASPYKLSAYAVVPLLIVVGGIAAVLGVFLIANSDTNELKHTLTFAVACGVFWQPVIQEARSFVVQAQAASRTSSLQAASNEVGQAATSNQGSLPSKVAKTGTLTTNLLSTAGTTSDTNLKAEAIAESTRAVDQISAAAPKAPEESFTALENIGVAAVKNNQTDVAKRVIYKLDALSAENPQLAGKARTAILTTAQQPTQELTGAQKN